EENQRGGCPITDADGFFIGHPGRFDSHWLVFRQTQVLGMRTRARRTHPKHLVPWPKGVHRAAHSFNFSGEFKPQHRPSGSGEAIEQSDHKRLPLAKETVRRPDDGRMHAYEDFMVLGSRLGDFLELKDIWCSVVCVPNRFHRFTPCLSCAYTAVFRKWS